MAWAEITDYNEAVQSPAQNFADADLRQGRPAVNALGWPLPCSGNFAAGSKAGALAVKLIDYDGMFVPALAGQKSGEVGHANFQHPQRLREGSYGPEVDRFSHLVIYTALRCLAVVGRPLWERHDNGDNLL